MKAVNLLPSDQRATAKPAVAVTVKPVREGTPVAAYAVLGALAFAVAAAALLVLAGNTVSERRAELAQVKAEVQATEARAAALQSFADFDGLATQRIATVRGLASSRFDWDRALGDLARALPANVHLRSLEGSTSGGTTTGAPASGIQAPAIKLSGCTSSQLRVADLMSRLRNVRGVTRVSLARSQKAQTADAAAAPASPEGGTPAALCPKGSPPDFELTMYFERAVVPAGAAVNPSAASAAPSAAPAPGATPTATPGAATPPGATASTSPTTTTTGATP